MEATQVNEDEQPTGGEPGEAGEAGFGRAVPPSGQATPGDLPVDDGGWAREEPLIGKDEASPLADDEEVEGTVPPSPLWAMKDRRHIQWHLLPSHERHQRLRERLGSGDETVYAIDDGAKHVMIGRPIATLEGECEYCLIGRVPVDRFEELRRRERPMTAAFDGATELTVCGIAEVDRILTTNVFDVDRYDDPADIPREYLPGSPVRTLSQPLEITVD